MANLFTLVATGLTGGRTPREGSANDIAVYALL